MPLIAQHQKTSCLHGSSCLPQNKPFNTEPECAILTSGFVVQHAILVTILARGEHFVPQCSLLCSLPHHTHTHRNTHAADGLLFHSLPSTSPPPQIPPWLTARAQRQVEWHLSCLSLSSHHLSSSPTAPVSYWERGKEASKANLYHTLICWLHDLPPGGTVVSIEQIYSMSDQS